MAEIQKTKKQPMSMGKIIGFTFGGMLLFIVVGVVVVKMSAGSGQRPAAQAGQEQQAVVAQPQPAAGQTQYPAEGNPAYSGQPAGQAADIDQYMNGQNQSREIRAVIEQMAGITTQMTAMQTEFNQGNANLGEQLQKINNDLIMLDQRLTHVENTLKSSHAPASNIQMGNKAADGNRKPAGGRKVNPKQIAASSNGRTWLSDGKNTSLAVGDQYNGQTIVAIDDVRQQVYIQ